MYGDDLRVTDGASAGAWIRPRLGGGLGAVTDQVPKGYEAYARVFHPASDADGEPVSWAEVADALGGTAHREMQWHALAGDPDGSADSSWPGDAPSIGEMELPTLYALRKLLAAHTTDVANCFFGLCTILGWDDAFTADELRQPRLELPHGRDHIVVTGPLSAVEQLTWNFAPSLIWPADHTWLVATEVDFDSTLVGGSTALVDAIVESRGLEPWQKLEAWQVEPTDSLEDKINRVEKADG